MANENLVVMEEATGEIFWAANTHVDDSRVESELQMLVRVMTVKNSNIELVLQMHVKRDYFDRSKF